MLEIPEINIIAQQLNQAVQGKEILAVKDATSPHRFTFYFGEASDYEHKLVGKKWGSAEPVGMYVKVRIEDATLLFNDGINLRYLSDLALAPTKYQLLIKFSDGSGLVFTTQMYGGIMVFTDQEIFTDEYYQKSLAKPSPLSKEFDEAYFDQIITTAPAKTSLKALLATEQRIPGLGNGVLQDILFNAKLNPQTKVTELSKTDQKRLFKAVKQTLQTMVDQGGRNTEKDLFGKPGGYQTILSHKTLSEPCPDCGSWKTKKAYLGGSIYFCPECQSVKK